LQNTVPLADPPAPVTSQEAQQLKECVALLHKYEEGLPPEVQSYVQGIKAKDVKRSVKTLHSAVTSMGRSRDELQAAIAARSQLHSTWRTFLADSITRFQAYGQDFATQEENLVARIQEAKKAFEQAKENLSVEKAKASSLDTTVQEVSDEETEIKDVVLAAPDKITESLNHLTSSLEGLRSQAADLEKEEQKHKRPRLADAESAKPGSGDAAMPSFG
jgi:chromosome segregation ATPase